MFSAIVLRVKAVSEHEPDRHAEDGDEQTELGEDDV